MTDISRTKTRVARDVANIQEEVRGHDIVGADMEGFKISVYIIMTTVHCHEFLRREIRKWLERQGCTRVRTPDT